MLRQGLGCEPGLNRGTGLGTAVLLSLGFGAGILVPSRAWRGLVIMVLLRILASGLQCLGAASGVGGLSRKLSSVTSWLWGWTGGKEK